MLYVYEVYRQRSFSKAAKKLFITQPALSNTIKKLEARLGAPIFDRSTIPLSVTREGEFYIRQIEKIMQLERNIDTYFKDISELRSGRLSLGGSSYFSSFVLPEMIARFHKKYPGIHIDLYEGNVRELNWYLENEYVDIVIETSDYADSCDVNIFPYKTEHLILAVPEGYHLNRTLRYLQLTEKQIISGNFMGSSTKSVPLTLFKDAPFISMHQGNDLHTRAPQICRNAGFEIDPVIMVDQVLTGLNIAASGVGCFLVRSDVVKHYPLQGKLIYYKLRDPLCHRPVSFLCKQGRYMTAAMRGFLKSNSILADTETTEDDVS